MCGGQQITNHTTRSGECMSFWSVWTDKMIVCEPKPIHDRIEAENPNHDI